MERFSRIYKKCVICNKRRIPGSDVHLAHIPLDPVRCRQWVKAIGQEDLVYVPIEKLHELKFVCYDHFRQEDFNQSRSRLISHAVPTLNIPLKPLEDKLFVDFPLHIGQYPRHESLSTPESSQIQYQNENVQLQHNQEENSLTFGKTQPPAEAAPEEQPTTTSIDVLDEVVDSPITIEESHEEESQQCVKCGKSSSDAKVTLYRFPNPADGDILRCRAWAKYCWPESNWLSVNELMKLHNDQNMLLCRNHFEPTCFSKTNHLILRKFSVPGKLDAISDMIKDLTDDKHQIVYDEPSVKAPKRSKQKLCDVPFCATAGRKCYKFPKDPGLRRTWVKSLGVSDWKVNDHHRVCSEHFTENSFYETKEGRKLHSTAVPVKLLEPDTQVGSYVCRVCFAIHTNMRDIKDYSEVFEQITGLPAYVNYSARVPQGLCWYCVAKLQSAAAFAQRARRSDELLKEIHKRTEIVSISDIKDINRQENGLKPNLVKIIIDIVNCTDGVEETSLESIDTTVRESEQSEKSDKESEISDDEVEKLDGEAEKLDEEVLKLDEEPEKYVEEFLDEEEKVIDDCKESERDSDEISSISEFNFKSTMWTDDESESEKNKTEISENTINKIEDKNISQEKNTKIQDITNNPKVKTTKHSLKRKIIRTKHPNIQFKHPKTTQHFIKNLKPIPDEELNRNFRIIRKDNIPENIDAVPLKSYGPKKTNSKFLLVPINNTNVDNTEIDSTSATDGKMSLEELVKQYVLPEDTDIGRGMDPAAEEEVIAEDVTEKMVEILEKPKPLRKIDKVNSLFNIRQLSEQEQIEEFTKRSARKYFTQAKHQCFMCYRGFYLAEQQKLHFIKHSKQSGPFKCSICKYRYHTEELLTAHKKGHRRKEFTCKECNFQTRCRDTVSEHIYFHEQGCTIKYQCPICPKVFDKKRKLIHHRRVHRSQMDCVCEYCGNSFYCQFGLRIHKQYKHASFTNDSSSQELKGPHCEVCDIKFLSDEAYYQHLQISSKHLGGNNPNLNDADKIPEAYRKERRGKRNYAASKQYTCEQCNTVLKSYATYASHFSKCHPGQVRTQFPPESKRFMCEECGCVLLSSATLKDHKLGHRGLKRFKCDQCSRMFRVKEKLLLHLDAHRGILPPRIYQCRICPRAFRCDKHLKRHIFLHTGLKPHKCDFCGKCFSFSDRLKSHIKHVHYRLPWPRKKNQKVEEEVEVPHNETYEVEEEAEVPDNETYEVEEEVEVPDNETYEVEELEVSDSETYEVVELEVSDGETYEVEELEVLDDEIYEVDEEVVYTED